MSPMLPPGGARHAEVRPAISLALVWCWTKLGTADGANAAKLWAR